MTKQEEIREAIKKLDSVFNKKTSFTFSLIGFFAAQHYRGHILIEGSEKALHPQIIAHEYAHRITKRTREEPHTKTFFKRYKLVCQHLGIEPICMSIEACDDFVQSLDLFSLGDRNGN